MLSIPLPFTKRGPAGGGVLRVCGVVIAAKLSFDALRFAIVRLRNGPNPFKGEPRLADSVLDFVGGTPLIELKSLSKACGCRVLAKVEHLGPGGVKDRVAKALVEAAERRGVSFSTIIEATGGNTGIALALIAKAKGYKLIVTLPDCIAPEKIALLKALGADVRAMPLVPFDDEHHYVKEAIALTASTPGSVLANQFESLANYEAHLRGTAPELWAQAGGRVDGFVCAAGTGGTIAGISSFLKAKSAKIACFLIDPAGSGLRSYVETGKFEAAGSSVIDGIGINRLTANFKEAKLDGVFGGSDREAIEMSAYLLRNEGLHVGPSAALNAVGAVKLARKLGRGKTIATVLCDSGDRYISTIGNPVWLKEKRLTPTGTGTYLDWVGE